MRRRQPNSLAGQVVEILLDGPCTQTELVQRLKYRYLAFEVNRTLWSLIFAGRVQRESAAPRGAGRGQRYGLRPGGF